MPVGALDNHLAIAQGNMAVAMVEASAYVGLGFIVLGTSVGEAPSKGNGLLSTVVFSLLGLAAMGIFYRGYNLLFLHFADVDYDGEIMQGNKAPAFQAASQFLVLGLIIGFSVAGDFTGWRNDLRSSGLSLLYGLVLLVVFMPIVARLLLLLNRDAASRDTVRLSNPAFEARLGCIATGLALIIAAA